MKLSTWLFMGLLLQAGFASAADDVPWYQVEVIVFAQKGAPYIDSERWAEQRLPNVEGARQLLRAPTGERQNSVLPFQQLPAGSLQLAGAYRSLTRSKNYEPLSYLGWVQPGLPREKAVPVRVRIDQPAPPTLGEGAPQGAEQLQASASAVPADSPLFLPVAPSPPRVEGTVTLVLSRYLHFETDLAYRLPAEGTRADLPMSTESVPTPVDDPTALLGSALLGTGPEPAPLFSLRETRRMRSNELHYIDHPMFGVIVKAVPYDPPKPEATNEKPGAIAVPANGGVIQRR